MAGGKFKKQLSDFQRKAMVQVDQVRRASILEMFSLVIDATPVDEGFLKGAWQTTVNSPFYGRVSDKDPSGAAAKVRILANMGKLTEVVWFTNTMPYAYRIEYESWSAQAPGGMVRSNIPRWKSIVAAKAKVFINGNP